MPQSQFSRFIHPVDAIKVSPPIILTTSHFDKCTSSPLNLPGADLMTAPTARHTAAESKSKSIRIHTRKMLIKELNKLRFLVSVLVLVTAAILGSSGKAYSQARDGKVRSQHGDWQIVCKPPPAGASNEVCAIVQSVTAEDRNNVGLTVYFQKFSDGTQVLRVFAPLGVLLPPGLGLKIDGQDVGNAPFLRCHSFACYAQVTVDPNLVNKLSTGNSAIFIIFQTEEAGIGIPISLAGFQDALSKL